MHTSFAVVPPIPEATSFVTMGKLSNPCVLGKRYTQTWVLVTTSKHRGKGLTTYLPWVGWDYSRASGGCGGQRVNGAARFKVSLSSTVSR